MASPRMEAEVKENLTESCYCPVTLTPFQSPVCLTNGKTVEEQVALKWFHELNKTNCPISREPLKTLQPQEYVRNFTLLNIIQEFQAKLQSQKKEFETQLHDAELNKITSIAKEREKVDQYRKQVQKVLKEVLETVPNLMSELKNTKQQLNDTRLELARLKNQRQMSSKTLIADLKEECAQIRATRESLEKMSAELIENTKKITARLEARKKIKAIPVREEKSISIPAGATDLMQAVIHDDRSTIKKLCQQVCVDVNAIDNQGDTALHYALAFNNVWAIKFLIGAGANIALTNLQQKTPEMIGREKYGKEWNLWKVEYKGLVFFTQKQLLPLDMPELENSSLVVHSPGI